MTNRVALMAIVLGLLLAVIGVFGYVNQNGSYLLLWIGLVALIVGIVARASRRERPARD